MGVVPARIDHASGEKRGRLTFIEEVERVTLPSGQAPRRARFRCDCGAEVVCQLRAWRDGKTGSCGCLQADRARETKTTHGRAARAGQRDPLYGAWKAMRGRCGEAWQAAHPTYAGVTWDERWATFEGFLAHQPAGRSFEPGLHLARFGDKGDYTPENTRWATKAENVGERNRLNKRLLPDGRAALDVAAENGISPHTFGSRVYRYGWDPLDAATRPPRS